jgi:hypothetical protein
VRHGVGERLHLDQFGAWRGLHHELGDRFVSDQHAKHAVLLLVA